MQSPDEVSRVVDFTLYKLHRMLGEEQDAHRAEVLCAMIQAYLDGYICVDWDDGDPVFSATPDQVAEMEAAMSGTVKP